MIKAPPCVQYEPPKHSLMTSTKGLSFCRKARQAGPTKPKKSPKKAEGPRKAKRPPPRNNSGAGPSKPKVASPKKNVNQANINYLRILLRNVPAMGVNRVGRMLLNKAKHQGAYKSKKNINNNIKTAAAVGFMPKQTLNQVRATRLEAIRAAQMVRKRMGLPVLNR